LNALRRRLPCNPVDFVSQYWLKLPWGAFYLHIEDRRILPRTVHWRATQRGEPSALQKTQSQVPLRVHIPERLRPGDKIRVNLHRGKIEDAIVRAVI